MENCKMRILFKMDKKDYVPNGGVDLQASLK